MEQPRLRCQHMSVVQSNKTLLTKGGCRLQFANPCSDEGSVEVCCQRASLLLYSVHLGFCKHSMERPGLSPLAPLAWGRWSWPPAPHSLASSLSRATSSQHPCRDDLEAGILHLVGEENRWRATGWVPCDSAHHSEGIQGPLAAHISPHSQPWTIPLQDSFPF